MMWDAIAYVSSGVTLVAFLSAVIAWSYKYKSEERERLIRTAKPEQRADLVRNALEFFDVDTTGLTKEQQYKIALEQINARAQRFKITSLVICFLTVVAASVTAYAITEHKSSPDQSRTEVDARFDVKYDHTHFLKVGEKIRSEIVLRAISLTQKNEEAARIFTGMIVVHNEELVNLNQDSSQFTCKDTPSCIGAHIFSDYDKNPLIVRGGNEEPVNITTFFDLPLNVKYIRIYWEFYQREANNKNLCVTDTSKLPPAEGIPYLKVVSEKEGGDIKDVCWRATDMTVVPVVM